MNIITPVLAWLGRLLGWAVAHPDEAAQTVAIVGGAAAALRKWAVDKKAIRWASFADALSRSAGRVQDQLKNIPAGMTVEEFKRRLILVEVQAQVSEFGTTIRKAGLSPEAGMAKAEEMIRGELGKLPTPTEVVKQITTQLQIDPTPLRQTLDQVSAQLAAAAKGEPPLPAKGVL